TRYCSAEILGNMGSAANAALPKLTLLLKDKDDAVRGVALKAIVQIGPTEAEIPAILAVPSGLNFRPQNEILRALKLLGPKGKMALPFLLPKLKEGSEEDKIFACQAVQEIGPDAAEAVPALIALLSDANERIQNAAIDALGSLGPAAKDS